MNRIFVKAAAVGAATAALLSLASAPAHAGGASVQLHIGLPGYVAAPSYGYPPVYTQPAYTQPAYVYTQPAYVYTQPTYVYTQPTYGYGQPGWSHRHSRGRDRDHDGIPDRWDRDRDNDGVPNRWDRDRDGDGVPNRWDRRPDNPRRY